MPVLNEQTGLEEDFRTFPKLSRLTGDSVHPQKAQLVSSKSGVMSTTGSHKGFNFMCTGTLCKTVCLQIIAFGIAFILRHSTFMESSCIFT